MRWRETFLSEVSEKLVQFGVHTCVVRNSANFHVDPLPVLVLRGGLPPTASNTPLERDRDRQMDYMVRVECGLCGNNALFSSERYRTGDEQILTAGLADEEEDELG